MSKIDSHEPTNSPLATERVWKPPAIVEHEYVAMQGRVDVDDQNQRRTMFGTLEEVTR